MQIEATLRELEKKLAKSARHRNLVRDQVQIAFLLKDKKTLAKALATDLQNKDFSFGPLSEKNHRDKNGKERILYSLDFIDLIVHHLLAKDLTQKMEPSLSPNLYSYRRGRNWYEAVSSFAAYLRRHRGLHQDPKKRGLYVLKRDVSSYTDSIPVGSGSNLWEMLAKTRLEKGNPILSFLKEALAAPVLSRDGERSCKLIGLPTGSPLCCPIFNLYLSDLDHLISAYGDGFYARYGDDLLFATPHLELALEIEERADQHLKNLSLKFSEKKRRNLFFSGSAFGKPGWEGVDKISWLGAQIHFRGTLAAKPEKVRLFLKNLRLRVQRLAETSPQPSLESICQSLNLSFSLNTELCESPVDFLLRGCTDRSQLRHLDHLIRLTLAETLSGVRGVKAYRFFSPDDLVKKGGLTSLTRGRNV